MDGPIDGINRQIISIGGVYGAARGPPRRAAFDFLLDLNRSAPEYYGCGFLEDVCGRMAADCLFNITECVRRLLRYLGKTAPSNSLRAIALAPEEGRKTFRREPLTFKTASRRGYWTRAITPELQMEKRGRGRVTFRNVYDAKKKCAAHGRI